MALARNMSVVEVRPQPTQPGVVARIEAASRPRPQRAARSSSGGAQLTTRAKEAITTAEAARATGRRAAHSETPNSLKDRATSQ